MSGRTAGSISEEHIEPKSAASLAGFGRPTAANPRALVESQDDDTTAVLENADSVSRRDLGSPPLAVLHLDVGDVRAEGAQVATISASSASSTTAPRLSPSC